MSVGVHIESNDDLRGIDISLFPVSLNFKIVLEDAGTSGSTLRFTDLTLGKLVTFPWWDDPATDIREWSISDIPEGSLESPYWDADQGWHIYLWRVDEYLFVAQGGEVENWFDVLLRVPFDLYQSEWVRVIRSLSD